MSKSASYCALIFIIIFNISCSTKVEDLSDNASIEEIYALAQNSREKGNYEEAGDFYMEIDRLFPYSDKARDAIIEAMKSYHQGSDLLNARLSAKRYLALYPSGEEVAFARYIIGLSYYDAIVDVSRDQGAAANARREFRLLIKTYPESEYSNLAKTKLEIAHSQLAGQEMVVGRFYMRRADYLAAINRFSVVANEYADTVFEVEALFRLVESYTALGMSSLAQTTNKKLSKQHPNSVWAKKSEELTSKYIN